MPDSLATQCCIVGGGPAGLMLGFLLARAGVDVVVLEKHADFLRDFRGDTIHPSTLAVIDDLGLLDEFLALPHQRVDWLSAQIYGQSLTVADFTRLHTVCRYLVLMPQWDFLEFIARKASALPNFRLCMSTRGVAAFEHEGAVAGVTAEAGGESLAIRCELVVAADGRHTTIRESAGLASIDFGAPIDVLWFRLPRKPAHGSVQTGGYVRPGLFLILLDRGSYWQCAYVIPKGGFDALRASGLATLKARVVQLAPFVQDSLDELCNWEEVKLLSVQVSRMPRWYRDGLLCIGDAAHAMSPVGGVGINLAIQDAVAAARLLAGPLRAKQLRVSDLAAVQRRREWPVRITQRMQIAIQNRILAPLLAGQQFDGRDSMPPLPFALRALRRFPVLNRIPARLIGIGIRPERVRGSGRAAI